MNKNRFAHAAPFDVFAAGLTACSFFAIWLLWPASKGAHHVGVVARQGTRYVFRTTPADNSRNPTQLIRPFLGIGEIVGREGFDDREAMVPLRSDPARLLEMPPLARTAERDMGLQNTSLERRTRAYVEEPVFAPVTSTNARTVHVGVSDALRERAFDTSVLASSSFPPREVPWTIRASLEVDEHGNVAQALLIATVDAELNAAVLRALYGSRAARGDGPCSGTVTISGTGKKPHE